MFKFMLIVVMFIVTAVGSYVSARILLPDMGLTVPDFGKFVAATLFVVVAGIIVKVLGAIIED